MAHSPLCRSDQWGAIFRSEDIDVADNNANAPAAVASSEARAAEAGPTPTASDGLGGEAVAADVMGATLLADADADAAAVDVAHALEHDADAVGGSHVAEPAAADPTPWTAYANGDPTAALGGRGVSTPADQCLAAARQRSESAVTAGAASGPAVAVDAGVERMTPSPLVAVADVEEDQDAPGFLYSSVEDWFVNLLAPTLERRLDAAGAGTLTWCPQWWAHAEGRHSPPRGALAGVGGLPRRRR